MFRRFKKSSCVCLLMIFGLNVFISTAKKTFRLKKVRRKRVPKLNLAFSQTQPNDSRALFPNKWAYKKGRSGVRTIYGSIAALFAHASASVCLVLLF